MAPTKRPSQGEPENSPEPKRRTKNPTSTRKKKADDDAAQLGTEEPIADPASASAEVKKEKKPRKSRKSEAPAEGTDGATPKVEVTVGRKSISIKEPVLSPPTNSTVALQQLRSPAQKTSSAVKSAPVSEAKPVLQIKSEPSSSSSSVTVAPLPVAPQPLALVVQSSTRTEDNESLADEGEILDIWQQAREAVTVFGKCILPFFLLIVLYFYIQSKITADVALASLAVVYFTFAVLILGTYIVATLPFILISRFLTLLVSDSHVTYEEQRTTNLYARFLLFFTLLGSVVVIFCTI